MLVGIEVDSAIIDDPDAEYEDQLHEVVERVNNSPLHKLLGYNNEYNGDVE